DDPRPCAPPATGRGARAVARGQRYASRLRKGTAGRYATDYRVEATSARHDRSAPRRRTTPAAAPGRLGSAVPPRQRRSTPAVGAASGMRRMTVMNRYGSTPARGGAGTAAHGIGAGLLTRLAVGLLAATATGALLLLVPPAAPAA